MSKPTEGTGAQVDVLTGSDGKIQASGSLATKLLNSGFNVNALRTNDVLRNREWIDFDTAVVNVARERLVAIGDLVQAGLTYPLANALGITRVEWETISDLTDASVSMSGLSQGQNDRFETALTSVPVPIVHKDFKIDIRALHAYRNLGQPLDMMQVEVATRVVAEKLEAILFNGVTVGVSGSPVYGYTNAPNRITGSTTVDWNTATGAQILGDVLAMQGAAAAKNMFGPFIIYCSQASFIHLGDDFKANGDKTILERLLDVPNIMAVKPTQKITDSGVVIMVQMTRDVVDIVDGIQPTVVSWESQGGFLVNFKVLAIMVPRMKSTYTLQSGIIHYT